MLVNVVMYILIAGIIACIAGMFVIALWQGEEKKMPEMIPAVVLEKKDAEIDEDISIVAGKLGLRAHAKISLSAVVQTKSETIRRLWNQKLRADYIDYLLCDPRTQKPLLAIMTAETGFTLEQRHPLTMAALDSARIPHIQLGNYNLAGLEKVVKDKLAEDGFEVEKPAKKGKRGSRLPAADLSAEGADETADAS